MATVLRLGLGGFLFVLVVALSGCDQVARYEVSIVIKDDIRAKLIVLEEIDRSLIKVGLRRHSSPNGFDEGGLYEGALTFGERTSNLMISVKPENRVIQLSTREWFSSRMTPEMKKIFIEMKTRLLETGEVEAVRVGSRELK